MKLKMKFLTLALMVPLLPSCGSNNSQKEKAELLNKSALYDPPTVTLIDGQQYQFKEGKLDGRGQKFHSDYSYLRALVVGGE